MVKVVPVRDLHRVVVTCVVHRFNLYLIKKRRPDREPFPGRWETPGGGLERADYEQLLDPLQDGMNGILEVVARREVLEETNLTIGHLRYLGSSCFIRSDKVPVIVVRFAAPYVSGEVILDKEATEYRWISAHEAAPYNLIGSIAADIATLEQNLRGGVR